MVDRKSSSGYARRAGPPMRLDGLMPDQDGLRCVAALEVARGTERSRGTIGVRSKETSASTSFVIWIQSQYERSIAHGPIVCGPNAIRPFVRCGKGSSPQERRGEAVHAARGIRLRCRPSLGSDESPRTRTERCVREALLSVSRTNSNRKVDDNQGLSLCLAFAYQKSITLYS